MIRIATATLGLATLMACGPNPVGTWDGLLELQATDGTVYGNELVINSDDTAEAEAYFTFDDPETSEIESLIGGLELAGDWTRSGTTVTIDFSCTLTDCDFNPTWTCELEDPGMVCDSNPDIYGDDRDALQFE